MAIITASDTKAFAKEFRAANKKRGRQPLPQYRPQPPPQPRPQARIVKSNKTPIPQVAVALPSDDVDVDQEEDEEKGKNDIGLSRPAKRARVNSPPPKFLKPFAPSHSRSSSRKPSGESRTSSKAPLSSSRNWPPPSSLPQPGPSQSRPRPEPVVDPEEELERLRTNLFNLQYLWIVSVITVHLVLVS